MALSAQKQVTELGRKLRDCCEGYSNQVVVHVMAANFIGLIYGFCRYDEKQTLRTINAFVDSAMECLKEDEDGEDEETHKRKT